MSAQYPSSIIAFPTRVNGQVIDAGDINSPDTEITAIQSFVGTQSSTFGMTYDLRSPNSNGGGHVQSADKGGTGQISYTKGDILVAQSASALGKLAAGPDGYVPSYDSTQTSGMKPTAVATEANLRNQAATYALASVLSASVWGITFPNIVSVLQAGQAFQVKFPTTNTSSMVALQVSSLVAQRIVLPNLANPPVGAIASSMIGILENDGTNFQLMDTAFGGTAASNTSRVQASRANAAGTGTQTIAHGLKGIPSFIEVFYTQSNGTNGSRGCGTGTATDPSNYSCTYFWGTNNTNIAGQKSNAIIYCDDAVGNSQGTATLSATDSTNVTLSWSTAASVLIYMEFKFTL